VSTSRKHEKDSALVLLRTQIEQRTQAQAPAAPTATSAGSVSSVPVSTIAQPVTNIGPEPPVYYTVDGIELFDNEGLRWGEIVSGVPVGDYSSLTAIRINAVLSRVDDSTFILPSRAQYVTDVWFDNLKAEPTNHYLFFPDDLINTIAAQAPDVIVTALYLNKDEG
jgi:hypothetical protein